MKKLILLTSVILAMSFTGPEWGFFGHRKINRMAVFTLPPEMIGFYKTHVEYITEHAIDPDKRRYSTKFEAIRHYIDIDHWGTMPFDNVPREFAQAFLKFGTIQIAQNNGDTLSYQLSDCYPDVEKNQATLEFDCGNAAKFFYESVFPNYYEDIISCDCEAIKPFLGETSKNKLKDCNKIIFIDHFSEYGILPYWLPQYYEKLVRAMVAKDQKRILRISAEIGHYIGDGHVPLHTTENYNGQLSDQIGIHAFWESRLPELFADDEYDFIVGPATYISDVGAFSWEMILESHDNLDEVLDFEKKLSIDYPQDEQICFDVRNELTIKTQCEAYAAAYHGELDGMVEQRMKDAVHAIGSIWYSAWIDAGQPDLNKDELSWSDEDADRLEKLEQDFKRGDIKGRVH